MTRIQLGPNEEIRVEGGAMVSMSDGITIKTKMQGGLLQSMARTVFGGESFFIKAPRHFEWVERNRFDGGFAPPNPAPLAAAGVRGELGMSGL